MFASPFGKKPPTAPPPPPVVPYAEVAPLAAEVARRIEKINGYRAFDASAPALVAAWEGKKLDEVKRLLLEGDESNRIVWARAQHLYNRSKDDADRCRRALAGLLPQAQTALAQLGIDADMVDFTPSLTMRGVMDRVALPRKTFVQHLQPRPGMAVGQALRGGSWQAAVAAVAVSAVILAVQHQQLLRQLKELEGQMGELASQVAGDLSWIAAELREGLLPRINAMLNTLHRLEEGLARFDATPDLPRAEGFALAMAVREARYYVETKAGSQ